MFRVPKSNSARDAAFYGRQYQEGFTTDCPSDRQLTTLKQTAFRKSEKDYGAYIEVLKAAGLRPGNTLFDFGCSWGYGSWQFRQAGFRVYSYEVSRSRARYAAEKLNCDLLPTPMAIEERVDCFFSAHVIEHLSNPGYLWEIAKATLKPDGVVIIFMPNGEHQLEERYGRARYHKLWGQVHPLLLSAEALVHMSQEFSFAGCAYSSPYDLTKIAAGVPDTLHGDELLFVARRAPRICAGSGRQ
jgi:SAM-dependent methyltransferase